MPIASLNGVGHFVHTQQVRPTTPDVGKDSVKFTVTILT